MKADTARTVAVPITAAEADDGAGSGETPEIVVVGEEVVDSVAEVVVVESVAEVVVVDSVAEVVVVDSVYVVTSSADLHAPLWMRKLATAMQLLSYVLPLEHTGSIFLGHAMTIHSPS